MTGPAVLIAIAGGVYVVSKVVEWCSNQASADEKQRQRELRHERDALIDEINAQRYANAEAKHQLLRKSAKRHRKTLLANLDALRTKQQALLGDFTMLFENLETELARPELSPIRRTTIHKKLPYLQNGFARLQAYQDYLTHYQEALDRKWHKEQFEDILECEPASPTLPEEWLYVGKVVALEGTKELNHPTVFGQRIVLTNEKTPQGWSDSRQQVQFSRYQQPYAVPVQLVKQDQHNPKKFFACVARGSLWQDHIMTEQPVLFEVERYHSQYDGYFGSLLDGSLRAFLPAAQRQDRSRRLKAGEILDVWPSQYDLCLNTNGIHTTTRLNAIEVSASRATVLPNERIALLVGEFTQHAELIASALLSDTPWCLMPMDESVVQPAQSDITCRLQNGQIAITASIDTERGMLHALCCEKVAISASGIELPFALQVVDSLLADEPLLHKPDMVEPLISFVMMSHINPQREALRVEQHAFIQRWQAVLDYQKQENCFQSITFDALPIADKTQNDVWEIILPRVAHEAWCDAFEANERPILKLSVWTAAADVPDWLPVCKEVKVDVSSTTELRLQFSPQRGYPKTQLQRAQHSYSLSLESRDAALKRQQQALADFQADKLVEPVLKELLLTPQFYYPQSHPEWQQRVAQGLSWFNPHLTETQKQVIHTCLTAKHLALVQGPPGTAKTTCIVELLAQIFSAEPNCRVLLVSQQNMAVDNALERLTKVCGQLSVLRVGREERIDPMLQGYAIEPVLMKACQHWQAHSQLSEHNDHPHLTEEWRKLVADFQARLAQHDVPLDVAELVLEEQQLVGATCVGLASSYLSVDRLTFDVAIVDEAGRATVPELLIPLLRAKKVILIGDHHQLPPAVSPLLREEKAQQELPFLDEAFLQVSFFERLFHALPEGCRATLTEQYRMTPEIGDLVAELFYTDQGQRRLFNGVRPLPVAVLPKAMGWVDVKGRHQRGSQGQSLKNEDEARAIVDFMDRLRHNTTTSLDVAVITPYRAQVDFVRKVLQQRGAMLDVQQGMVWGHLRLKVNTVDSFQGSEADVVCYSIVRSSGSLQFLLDKKRLNVACSRARAHLYIFGSADFVAGYQDEKNENILAQLLARLPRV